MEIPNLVPDPLAKLGAPGLRDQTIAVARLSSARPADLPRLIGRTLPDGVLGPVLPYPGPDGCR
jgi:hypothetical protein